MKAGATILVTGGAGYIGSHVCKHLAATGYQPVCYDNLSTGHRWAVQWGPLEVGDIRDAERLDRVFHDYRPAAVMHFAASSLVSESVARPAEYYRNNVIGSLNLAESMVRNSVENIVFSSTCAVYGEPMADVICEDHPRDPINPYGATKLAIERMLEDFSNAGALRHATLRYFNAAGADRDGLIGECHEPETHLIPLVLQAVSGRRSAIQVYGRDYPTPDGSCIRDYIDVTDLAEAHRLALEGLLAGSASMAVNLGTGVGTSVMEIIGSAERVTDRAVPWEAAGRRAGDPARLVASNQLASELLGWTPSSGSIDGIIANAWHWEQHCCRQSHGEPVLRES